jgi:hypothetical protein
MLLPLMLLAAMDDGPAPPDPLAQAQECVGLTAAVIETSENPSLEDRQLFASWTGAYLVAAVSAKLRPTEIDRRMEQARLTAQEGMAHGDRVAGRIAACKAAMAARNPLDSVLPSQFGPNVKPK